MVLSRPIVNLTGRKGLGICPAERVSICIFPCNSGIRSYLVARWHPSSLLDKLLSVLVDLRSSLSDLINSSILPLSSALNITQGFLKTPQFNLNLALCLLGILQSDLFEALNGLDLLTDIVGLWLEGFVVLLDLVDHLCVLQDTAVVGEVDCLGLFGELLDSSASIVVSLLETRKGSRCLASEAELGADFAPVELCCSALRRLSLAFSFNFREPSDNH